MRYNTRSSYGSSFGSNLPLGVKWLLIVNVALFLLNVVFDMTGLGVFFDVLKLTPSLVVNHGFLWQIVTYMFLHSTADPLHILFNMLALWMFGAAIERTWGTRKFLKYYFVCGVGAGLCIILVALLTGSARVTTLGASGAIYGLLLAFGLLFPETIVFFIIFPLKAKYLVMIMGGLALFFSVRGGNGGVSNVGHLGGLVIGYVYMRLPLLNSDTAAVRRKYEKWKLERAKRKFEVYMRKQSSDREPRVH